MKERNFIQYAIISLKGMAMGAADVVPGVSGGTIAFISGIYEELLSSVSSVNFKSLQILRKEGLKSFWKAINGNFLAALLVGIFISIISLAKLISWALENEPILVWSFFFGLVLASIIYVGKQISEWDFIVISVLVFGIGFAYYITTLEPIITENSSLLFIFMAGAIAICAMILPGISGAFILVLLGAYKPVLDAIDEKDIKLLAALAFGAIVGLLTFSKILKWLFVRYRNLTLAILTGFIIGSLNKIWPWKEVISWRVNSKGEQVPFNEESIFPNAFNGDPQLFMAIVLAIFGFSMILILEKLSKN